MHDAILICIVIVLCALDGAQEAHWRERDGEKWEHAMHGDTNNEHPTIPCHPTILLCLFVLCVSIAYVIDSVRASGIFWHFLAFFWHFRVACSCLQAIRRITISWFMSTEWI